MINPSELRVGNFILFNKQPIMVKGVTENAVMLDGVMFQTDNPNYPYQYQLIPTEDERLAHIPLTDDMFRMISGRFPMGGRNAYKYYGSKATFLIFEDEEGYYIGMTYLDQVFRMTPQRLDYFHQLQNIYFAQYGSEFVFKERLLSLSIKNAVDDGLI